MLENNNDTKKNNEHVENDAERIFREVEKRKLRAKDLEVDTLISKLYFDSIKYYPHWIKSDPSYVCSLITNPTEVKEKENNENITKTRFSLQNKEYIFTFKSSSFSTPDGEWHTHGDLELYSDGRKILALSVGQDIDEYSTTWSPFAIDAFIEGEWINDFKNLEKQIELDRQMRDKNKREAPDKLNKLKQDFDIN